MDLAIGFFDGVHLGHRRILSRADAALTFSTHPLSLLAPDKAPALLMTLEERLAAIRGALRPSNGGEVVRALPFTREFAAMPPADFAGMLRRDYPSLGTVFCGPNWNFGAGGAGNAEYLASLGFKVETVPFETAGGDGESSSVSVSSTRIRAALAAGDVEGANAMLGRRYAISGEVVRGKGLGGEMGFPTINVKPANPDLRRLLPFGVYAVSTELGRGLANWGQAPTMGERSWEEPVLEVHVVDDTLDSRVLVPQAALKVSLMAYIRSERKFASLAELKAQIIEDIRTSVLYNVGGGCSKS